MASYGFIIDQDSCIGCHACTVACKTEHDVPLGPQRDSRGTRVMTVVRMSLGGTT